MCNPSQTGRDGLSRALEEEREMCDDPYSGAVLQLRSLVAHLGFDLLLL